MLNKIKEFLGRFRIKNFAFYLALTIQQYKMDFVDVYGKSDMYTIIELEHLEKRAMKRYRGDKSISLLKICKQFNEIMEKYPVD